MSTLDRPLLSALATGLVYLIPLLGLYHSSHRVLLQWWQRGDYNYCYLVPLIVVYLVWEKRDLLGAEPSRPTWVGLLPLMGGLALFWLGELGGEFYSLFLSSWLVLCGLLWTHLGWRKLRTIAFPLAFTLTMFPPPNWIYFNLSLKLKLISSKLGVWALQGMGKAAYREGNVIDLGFTQLQVVDACNGLRYLFPLVVLAILVSYLTPAARWKKVVIVCSAVPVSMVVNGLRIASVGLLYPLWGLRVTDGLFHDLSGWVIFMLSLGFLLAEAWLLNGLFRRREAADPAAPSPPRAPAPAMPVSAMGAGVSLRPIWRRVIRPHFILAISLVGSSALVFQWIDFRGAQPISRPLGEFPLVLGEWIGAGDALAENVISELKFSDYLMADYRNRAGKSVSLYTAYYDSQRKGASIHTPDSCLPGNGWLVRESGLAEVALSPETTSAISVNRALIQKGGHAQLTYYWFSMRGRIAHNILQLKLLNFWDALSRRRTDGALVRLVTPVYGGESPQIAERRLQTFLRQVLPLLNDFLPQ